LAEERLNNNDLANEDKPESDYRQIWQRFLENGVQLLSESDILIGHVQGNGLNVILFLEKINPNRSIRAPQNRTRYVNAAKLVDFHGQIVHGHVKLSGANKNIHLAPARKKLENKLTY
jgi:hypothetical protein